MKIMRLIYLSIVFSFMCISCFAENINKEFLILCYHDIPKEVNLNNYSVDQNSFIQQIEYLKAHGYNFISIQDVIDADNKKKGLPEKAVLLSFDDAYLSFYEFVYPLLKLYNYPCVLSVVTSWVDNPPKIIKEPLMNWQQLKEVSDSKLVYIASHSHNLHRAVVYNPQGNDSWAAVTRIYDKKSNAYESEDEFRKRIFDDLNLSRKLLKDRLSKGSCVLVWPYGRYNDICLEEAKKSGFTINFYLYDKKASLEDEMVFPRFTVVDNPTIQDFIKFEKRNFSELVMPQRILQADLDMIYDEDPVQCEKNLDSFVERVFNLKVTTVYLQAFCDINGDGNIKSVYFPNRVLPMKADFFNRVANQLSVRGIKVYAWMPMLSISFSDKEKNDLLRVKEYKKGKIKNSSSWYNRLSPFNSQARQKLILLYEDLAINARIDGVVFQDDGYLNDFEDFNDEALGEYKKITLSKDFVPYKKLTHEQKNKWINKKTEVLIDLTNELKQSVIKYRPRVLFARTLYVQTLLNPKSEEWFAQNYKKSLNNYDYVILMSYPMMEKIKNPKLWLKKMVDESKKFKGGIEKTVFKVQTYDWSKSKCIDTGVVVDWLRILIAQGAKNVAYYPDNYVDNCPDEKIIRTIVSTEDFPFKRKYTIKDFQKDY